MLLAVTTPGWRAEDQALLDRLEDASVARAMLRDLAPERAGLGRRGGGLVRHLRARPGGEEARRRASAGDRAALLRVARPARYAGLDPELLHQLALFEEAASPRSPRALAAWLALAADPEYLSRRAEAVAGDALAERERAAATRALPFALLARREEEARAGADARDRGAAAALDALGAAALKRTLTLAGLDAEHPVAAEARRRARQARERVLDGALAPHRDRLDELATVDLGPAHAAALEAVTRSWRWAGQDPLVARFAVERAVPLGWVAYNAKRMDTLRALDGALAPLVDAFASRVQRDPAELAYAGPCAQLLVFRAELKAPLPAQIAVAETAVAVCPTHRNGRLVLADLLTLRGERALAEAGRFSGRSSRRSARTQALADYRRARALFPSLTSLPRLADRLLREGVTLDEDAEEEPHP